MGTPSSWATGSSIPGPARRAAPWSTSSATAWRGSSPWRIWRSGPSTRSESRPLTALGRGPGARRSGGGPESLVSLHHQTPRGTIEHPDSNVSVVGSARRTQCPPADPQTCRPSPPPPAASWCAGWRFLSPTGTASSWDTGSVCTTECWEKIFICSRLTSSSFSSSFSISSSSSPLLLLLFFFLSSSSHPGGVQGEGLRWPRPLLDGGG